MTASDYLVLAALAVVVLALAVFAGMVRWQSRASARKEELLYAKIGDLLDRNMHLTDGGAFSSTRSPYRERVGDDEPLTLMRMGIVEDPYDAPDPGMLEFTDHPQPTVEELT